MRQIVKTYQATVCCGLRKQYSKYYFNIQDARDFVSLFVEKENVCVTFEPTTVLYSIDEEPGFKVGFINDPMNPTAPEEIKALAVTLGELVKEEFDQAQVAVICTDKTIMLR